MTRREKLIQEISSLIVSSLSLPIPAAHLNAETTLTTIGGISLDSVDILEVIVAVEQTYKVKIKNAEEGRRIFSHVGAIADFVIDQTKLPVSESQAHADLT